MNSQSNKNVAISRQKGLYKANPGRKWSSNSVMKKQVIWSKDLEKVTYYDNENQQNSGQSKSTFESDKTVKSILKGLDKVNMVQNHASSKKSVQGIKKVVPKSKFAQGHQMADSSHKRSKSERKIEGRSFRPFSKKLAIFSHSTIVDFS